MLSITAIAGGAAAQPLGAGDLLVSWGDELWRVDPVSGARSRFSPTEAAPANQIGAEGADQIAIDPDGPIFLVSDGVVVTVDPVTGEQEVLEARTRVCLEAFCFFLPGPLDVGSAARGIDINPDRSFDFGDRPDLYVGSEEGVYRIVRDGGEVDTQQPWFDSPQDEFPNSGPLVASIAGGMWVAGPDLHPTGSPPTPTFYSGLGAPGRITAIESDGAVLVVAMTPGDGTPAAGVWLAGYGGFLPLTQGGFLRRPTGLALDPFRPDRIWVADGALGADVVHRIVRLDYDGVDWRQTLFAELPADRELHGMAVSPAAFAPEPGALALGATVAGVLLAIRSRR